ncbi:MAG: crosslink repair DNA glycosylase YcaQ family protein, partial [Anaerolineae bacterium]
MGAVLDAGLVRRLRLRAQGLAAEDGAATGGVEEVVRHLVGVQAQEAEGAALAIAIRHRGLSAAQVEAARLEARSIVRTWALRGTLHLVAAADLGWLLPFLAPGVIRGRRRRYA